VHDPKPMDARIFREPVMGSNRTFWA
jgi:hypothetical protein